MSDYDNEENEIIRIETPLRRKKILITLNNNVNNENTINID